MNLITGKCNQCQAPITLLEEYAHIGGLCETCIDRSTVKTPENRAKETEKRWEAICPPLYRDTSFDLLPLRDVSQKALEWKRGAGLKTGLNLWGFARTGKTRTMFLILQREHFSGSRVKFFGPSEFAQELEQRDFKTAAWIRSMLHYDIVAFDDIDKCKLTRPQEEKFFALLDARVRNGKPIFFTGNSNGSTLTTMFRNGDAIIGRIRDYCTSIHFPRQMSIHL